MTCFSRPSRDLVSFPKGNPALACWAIFLPSRRDSFPSQYFTEFQDFFAASCLAQITPGQHAQSLVG